MPNKTLPTQLPDGKLPRCLPPYPFSPVHLPPDKSVRANDYNPHDFGSSFKQAFDEGKKRHHTPTYRIGSI